MLLADGAGQGHETFDLVVEELGLPGVGAAVIDLLALPTADDQAGGLQQLQMVGEGGAAHLHHGCQVNDALLAVAEDPEQAQPVSVGELMIKVSQSFKGSYLRQLLQQAVAVLAMMVRQLNRIHGEALLRQSI